MKIYTKQAPLLVLFITALLSSPLYSIIDNRYLPLFDVGLPRLPRKPSSFFINAFVMQAKQGYDRDGEEIHIPELFGKYDLYDINDSMNKVGIVNPLFLDPWYLQSEIIWNMTGKIQVQGFSFGWEQALLRISRCGVAACNASLGVKSGFLHATSEQRFSLSQEAQKAFKIINNGELYQGQAVALELARMNANTLLGIEAPHWKKDSWEDTEVYARFGVTWDYVLKCRSIDLGLIVGGIVPTAAKRDIYNTASIPLGGDGFPGMFIKFNTQLEAREDWFLGFWIQATYRFAETRKQRMPVGEENPLWGAVVADAKVTPGMTFGISPFVALEDFYEGWGALLRFTYINHRRDCWIDKRENPQVTVEHGRLYDLSRWEMEYFSLGVLYDGCDGWFGKGRSPRFYFKADIPTHLFRSQLAAKTYKFTLGLEVNY
ncbi:MAG TPA: hypothetical protein QGF02_02700 [Candidatus Babeliales bacterium]|nr:hypothetical protein [Candidatus Babeliales bacterium]